MSPAVALSVTAATVATSVMTGLLAPDPRTPMPVEDSRRRLAA